MSVRDHNNVIIGIMLDPKVSLSTNRYSTTTTSIVAYDVATKAVMARVAWRHTGVNTKITLTMPIGKHIRKSIPINATMTEMEKEISDIFATMDFYWTGNYPTPPVKDKEEGEE